MEVTVGALSAAIESGDMDTVEAMLADEVVFRSPVGFKPYPGKAITNAILRSVKDLFADFRYIREIHDGSNSALLFEAKVDDLELTGCDFIVYDEDGKIVEFMVMVRPLSGAKALAARMSERFPDIQAAANAWTQAR